MILPAILDPFAQGAAPAVMTRLALGWMIRHGSVDPILGQAAEGQYDREFPLGHLVEVTADVACGSRKSPGAAFLRRQFDRTASLSAFDREPGRRELAVTAAIVHRAADRAQQLIAAAGCLPEPIPGYSARVLGGNVLAGADHRIDEPRSTRAATLPGKSPAIYRPSAGLVRDLIPGEDAHTRERASLERAGVEPGRLRIMDRDSCARTSLSRALGRGASFPVRRHASTLPLEPIEPLRSVARCEAGGLSEQPTRVDDPACEGRGRRPRRIVPRLDRPTREGGREVVLITNPPGPVEAPACRRAHRGRWEIEVHLRRPAELPHCETPTPGYPRASPSAFGMSVLAGDALAVLKGGSRAAHGQEMVAELSDHAPVDDLAEVGPGMMIAVPPAHRMFLGDCSAARVAELLEGLADRVPIERMLRSRRGPKRPRKRRGEPGSRIHHVATEKLLGAAKAAPAESERPRRGKIRS